MTNFSNIANKHKSDSRETLSAARKDYRDLELSILTEKIIRQAGGRNLSADYLKEIAASLYEEATKREKS